MPEGVGTTLQGVPSHVGECLEETERLFLSSVPEGTRTYRATSATEWSAEAASISATRDIGIDPEGTRRVDGALGPFGAYETCGKVIESLSGKPVLQIAVYGLT